MVKILSRSGDSLADVYDVEGSIAGIDHLLSGEVSLVHEMSGTIFSERLSMSIARANAGAVAQSTTWDITLADLGAQAWRILGVMVLASVTARTAHAQVSVRDSRDGREMPIFVWDTATDADSVIRIVENGGAAANQLALIPNPLQIPSMGLGRGQPQARDNEIVFRGSTTAFGAGTVTLIALIHTLRSQVGGLSSRGLPIPSW